MTTKEEARERIKKRWKLIDAEEIHKLKTYKPQCRICGFADLRTNFKIYKATCKFQGGELERYKCPVCGVIFGPRKFLELDAATIKQDYEDLYTMYREGDGTKKEILTFQTLNIQKEQLCINWGCGAWSRSLNVITQRGYKILGFDPFVSSNPQILTNIEDVKNLKPQALFSNNVIEHFIDPIEEFKNMNRCLPVGGEMAHSTDCYEYAIANTRFHTFFFVGKSIHILCEKTGFKVNKVYRNNQHKLICYTYIKIQDV